MEFQTHGGKVSVKKIQSVNYMETVAVIVTCVPSLWGHSLLSDMWCIELCLFMSGSRYCSGGAVGPRPPTGQLQPGEFHLPGHAAQHWQNRLCIQRGQDGLIQPVSPIFPSVCHWLTLCISYFVSFPLTYFHTLSASFIPILRTVLYTSVLECYTYICIFKQKTQKIVK